MKKNKKVIIIVSIVLIIVAIATTMILINSATNKESEIEKSNYEEENGKSKLNGLYDKLKDSKNYSISLTLNKDNVRTTSKKGDFAKVEIINQGTKNDYIVKDKMTYMLVENTEKVYKYKNNVALLNDFENKLDEILNKNFVVGTEEIDGKQYRYEEFNNTSVFVINFKKKIDDAETKTRVYFEGNDVKYIKTYIGDVEQLLKVEIKYDCMKNSDFDVPEEDEEE